MESYITLESNSCVKFTEALQKVEVKEVAYNSLFSKVYTTSYNGYFKVKDFIRDLNNLYKAFKYELQHLPLDYSCQSSRKIYLTNLYQNLLEIRSEVEEIYKTEVQPKFKYLYLGKDVVLKQFPEQFCELLYHRKIDYEHHKIHFMYHVQYRTINRAIDLVIFFAGNEGYDLTIQEGQKTDKAGQENNVRRIKTTLTLAQLSHIIIMVSDAVTDRSVAKSELAHFISETFETSRSKKPSKRQVYKAFFDVEESTREVVKDLVIEMLNKVRN